MAANSTPGGYDCNFLNKPGSSLKCLICLAVARDPRQHEECGKLFCSECIEKYGTDKPCPNCKQTGTQFYRDNKSRRDIEELPVLCDNVKWDCGWVGNVDTVEEHLSTCEFAQLHCPKECKKQNGDVKLFMRKDLERHLSNFCPNRDFSCEHCGEKGTYTNITQLHDTICPMKFLPCPNGCSVIVQRQHVSEHVTTECELTVIACKYKRLGCDGELLRKDMAAHEEDDKLHLHMAIDTTARLERDITALKNEKLMKFKLSDYQKKKENNECVQSPSYYTSPNGYHMALRVYANGTGMGENSHVSVSAVFLEGTHDPELKWPFTGKLTFILLNQLQDDDHYQRTINLTINDEMLVGSDRGRAKFIPHKALAQARNTQYLKDDTLYFRMSVEPADHKPWLQ